MSRVEIRNIGKKEAIEILALNNKNRRITRANVDFIKNEMVNNRFILNGATIVLSKDGTLLDGQHRLTALSETDLRFDFIFVLDAENDVFKTIDTGKNRNPSDILSIEKIKNANNVASTIRKVIEEFGTKRKTGKSGSVKISNTEVLDYYNKNSQEINEAVEFCHNLYSKELKVITVSSAAAFLILFSRVHKQKAKSFIRELFNGVRESESNAAQTLRKRLLNYKIDGTRTSDSLIRALFIISFKTYCEGRDISKIQISRDFKEYLFFKEDD